MTDAGADYFDPEWTPAGPEPADDLPVLEPDDDDVGDVGWG